MSVERVLHFSRLADGNYFFVRWFSWLKFPGKVLTCKLKTRALRSNSSICDGENFGNCHAIQKAHCEVIATNYLVKMRSLECVDLIMEEMKNKFIKKFFLCVMFSPDGWLYKYKQSENTEKGLIK